MIGFIYASLAAFFSSFRAFFSKKSMKHINEYVAAFWLRLFTAIILCFILLFFGIPDLGETYWIVYPISVMIGVAFTILYLKALKYSELSQVQPILAFTPLLLLLTSPIIVGEFPSVGGLLGVLFITVGSYVIFLRNGNTSFFDPIKRLFSEKGSRYMLLVATFFAIGSPIAKIGIQSSAPIFWIASVNVGITILLIPFLLSFGGKRMLQRKHWKHILPISIFAALTVCFQMVAYTYTLVVYVISIKRSGIVLSVIWGWLFLKEKNIRNRLLGSILMLFGVVLIAFG